MNEKELFLPKKRNTEEITELSDKVHAAKAAIKMKLNLEDVIERKEKLIKALKRTPWYIHVLGLFFRTWYIEYKMKREIECSETIMEVDVKLKLRNNYHRNELSYLEYFKPISTEMHERFDVYLDRLRKESISPGEKTPVEDVKKLLRNYDQAPPNNELDKLSFYISMEQTLAICQ